MPYYCARLLLVCLVDDGKPRRKNTCDYPFVLIRASSHEEAFERALVLGSQQEAQYRNSKGQAVRWAFVKVEAIKLVGNRLDGSEVGSLLDVLVGEAPVPYAKRFNPKRVKPLFT